jgi:hypothetical protein
VAHRPSPALALAAALVAMAGVGLGPGTARAIDLYAARVTLIAIDPNEPQAIAEPPDVRQIQLEAPGTLILTPVEPISLDLRAGGTAGFGRRSFAWLDGGASTPAPQWGCFPRPLGPSRVCLEAPVAPAADPPDCDRWCPLYPEPVPVTPGSPPVLDPLWSSLLALVTRSCVGGDDPACFNPGQAFSANRCSFTAPRLCASLRQFSDPFLAVPLQVDRLRIKSRRHAAKLWISGRIDLANAPIDTGAFSVAAGALTASIPLDAFAQGRRLRVWRGRGDGLRQVVLRDDGQFRILARNVAPELVAGGTLPLMLQVGDALGGASVPLE